MPELLHGREIRDATDCSWRRGQGTGDDGLWHFHREGRWGNMTRACFDGYVLGAGAVPCEGDPLCPECVAIALGRDDA